MTGDERGSTAVPRWLRAVERDPGATDLVALLRAIERISTSPHGDRDDDDELHVRFRAEPKLRTAAGRRLQVKATADPDEPAALPTLPTQAGPATTSRPPDPPTIELILHGLGALIGPTTPLPLALAEQASGPGPGSERLRAFLDLFHHRLFTHLTAGLARLRAPQASADAALWGEHLLGATGLASSDSAIPRSSRLRLLPLLLSASGRPTPALLDQALEICLRPVAGAGLRVHTRALSQTKAPRPRSTLSHLGSPRTRLRSAPTGCEDAPLLLGAQLSVRHGLTIELRGAADDSLDAFAQDEPGHRMIRELVDLLAPPGTRWELTLHPTTPRRARLGSARLGQTWLRGAPARAPLRVKGGD